MEERFDPFVRHEAMKQVPCPLGAHQDGPDCVAVYYPSDCSEDVLIRSGAKEVYRQNGNMVARLPLNNGGPTWIGNGEEETWGGIQCKVDYYFGEGCRDDYFRSVAVEHKKCLGGCMSKVFVPKR